jgi:hypothetical protein
MCTRVIAKLGTVMSLVLLVFLATNSSVLAQAFEPAQILNHPSSYDGKPLTVSGTVRDAVAQTTLQGKDYMTFELCDDACIKVFTWGHVKLREGQHQSVSGTFKVTKHLELKTFQNILEAHSGSIR